MCIYITYMYICNFLAFFSSVHPEMPQTQYFQKQARLLGWEEDRLSKALDSSVFFVPINHSLSFFICLSSSSILGRSTPAWEALWRPGFWVSFSWLVYSLTGNNSCPEFRCGRPPTDVKRFITVNKARSPRQREIEETFMLKIFSCRDRETNFSSQNRYFNGCGVQPNLPLKGDCA